METNINLNTLKNVVYNGKYIDSIVFNGTEIWRKQVTDKIYDASVTASTSNLDVGNYPRKDLTYSNGVILSIGKCYIYKNTSFSSWTRTTTIGNNYTANRCITDGNNAFCFNGASGTRRFSWDKCSTWNNKSTTYEYTSLGYANGYFFMKDVKNNMYHCNKANQTQKVSSSVSFDELQYDNVNSKYIYSSNNTIKSSTSFSLLGDTLHTCPNKVVKLIVNKNKFFAIYNNGVSISMDYGKTWVDKTLIDNNTDRLLNAVLDTVDGKIVLVGSNGHIYYTVNDFSTFHKCGYSSSTTLTFNIPKIFKAIDEDDMYVVSNNTFTKCYKIKLTERTD